MNKDTTNHQKLSRLFELYEQPMYYLAFSILHDAEDAEDAVADAFEKILGCIEKILDVESIDAKRLVLTIVKNKSLGRYRKNMYENELFTDVDDSQIVNKDNLIEFRECKREDKELYEEIANGLSDILREILMLHCYYEMSFAEIGRYLGISAATARKRFERAR